MIPAALPLLNEAARLTPAHRRILLFAWGAWCFGFYSLTLLSFLLEPIRRDLALSELRLAWLTGVGIGATGIGGLLFGWLADRGGRRRSLWLAIATFGAGNALAAVAPGFVALIAARAVAGLGIGGTWGAGQALIGETFPPERRGRFGAVAQTGAPIGLGLATIMGSFVAPAIGWRAVFALSALPAVALALLPAVPESDVWRQPGRGAPILRVLGRADVAPTFARCFVLTILNMSNYWLAVSWLPRYLQVERGLSLARSGWATLAFVAGSLTGYLLYGLLSDRWGRRAAFTLFCALMAGGLVMFTLFWGAIAARPALVLLFLFVAGVGTGTWSSYGPMMSELFPTPVRGTAMSVIMNATRAVQFAAPVLIAAVAPRWGMAGGIALAAAFAVAAGLWIWTLPETRGRPILAAP
jgi:MFS family permease